MPAGVPARRGLSTLASGMDHDLAYFTRPDGVTIAYGTAGDGPPLVVVPGWATHLEWLWREPATLLFEPLAHHFRVIMYDKHGNIPL